MSEFLPLRANLEWLKKSAKDRLVELRIADPNAQLSDAQFEIARRYGFSSWRALSAHVTEVRDKLRHLVPEFDRTALSEVIPPTDPQLLDLFAAVRAGEPQKVVMLLRQRPALVNARDAEGQTPLHLAAEYNDPQLGVVLLAHGADPEARLGESSHTALSWAVTCNAPEFAGALVRLAVKPDFFSAAGLGLLEEVQSFYVTSGELIPNASRSGSSRLAADGSRLPCPPETAREQLSDALYIAARNGHAPVVRFLLTKDPDLSFRAYMGATALHWAHFSGSQEVVHLLSAAGADPTVRDDSLRCTPRAFGICTSASWGIQFLVRRLLDADPSLVNFTDGSTSALHQAAVGEHLETVKLLLDRGADRSLKDAEGRTAFDVATSRGFTDILDLLRNDTNT